MLFMDKSLLKKLLMMIPVFLLSACNLQNKLLYYPAAYLPSQNELEAEGLQFWPSASNDYRGFISKIPADAGKGTVIVFHGNAGTASDRSYYAHRLAVSGRRVILAEYPGYGKRKGELGEASFVKDAKETVRLAFAQFGGKIFLLGESLGSGVAAAVAKDSPIPIEGIILVTPWDTLHAVAREKFPWMPVGLFLKDKYDTVVNLKTFPGKIAVIGAERDEVIPIGHALALYKALPGAKRMWTIKGAGHNDWPGSVDAAWWNDISDFIGGTER
jgi:hypothetical protein